MTIRTVTLGHFVRDELGTLHGRFSGLGVGSTAIISEEINGSDDLRLVADPLGVAYEVGIATPVDDSYTAVLDSPIFQAPLTVSIVPDTPGTFTTMIWERPIGGAA